MRKSAQHHQLSGKYTQNYSETITKHPPEWLKLERLTVPTVSKNMEHHALLVEVEIATTPLENCLAVLT